MSANIPAATDEMHIARSKFIEAYNAADTAVRNRLKTFSLPTKPGMSDNLNALGKIPANAQFSKDAQKKLASVIAELAQLRHFRCDVVHGQMTRATSGDAEAVMFSNVQADTTVARSGSFITLAEMKSVIDRIDAITIEISAPDRRIPIRSNVIGIWG